VEEIVIDVAMPFGCAVNNIYKPIIPENFPSSIIMTSMD
jgi:hypothetical protein